MLTARSGRVVLFYALVVFVLLCALWSFPRGNKLIDFGTFVASGRAALHGQDPYGVYDLTPHFSQGSIQGYSTNGNPPVSVPVFAVVSQLEPVEAFRAWYVISLALYAIVVLLLSRAYPERATPLLVGWALGLAGLWSTVNLGQIYIPLVLASTGAWLCLRRRHFVGAGVLIGIVVAVKPNFLVWPALLLLAGYTGTALVAVACAGLLSLVPAVMYGPRVYVEWFATFSEHPWIALPTNGSLYGLMARVGLPSLGVALSVVLLLALAVLTWRRRPSLLGVCELALLGSLLASPEAWLGYTLFLLPIFYRRSWTPLIGAAAVLLMVPETLVVDWADLSSWYFLAFGFLTNLALLFLLVDVLKSALSETATRPHGADETTDGTRRPENSAWVSRTWV